MLQHVFKSVCIPCEEKSEDVLGDLDSFCPDLVTVARSCRLLLYQGRASEASWWAHLLLDRTWEILNTGPWREVPLSARTLYSYGAFLKAWALCCLPKVQTQEVLSVCDMGLIMGAPILDNVLTKLAAALNRLIQEQDRTDDDKHVQTKIAAFDIPNIALRDECHIEHLTCPSLEAFQDGFFATGQPLVMTRAIDYWPAVTNRKWSVSYLKQAAGSRMVPVELGSRYTDGNWTQELMTVSDFIDKYIVQSEHGVAYLAQHQLFDQIPELRKDISVPTYCCLGKSDDVDINAWFGPKGTVSPLHFDPKHNFLAQVVGYKYVRLYSEEYSSSLYPFEDKLLANTSQVDVEAPDEAKFPSFSSTPYSECMLRPGDMLYIPPRCWHFVRSLSLSFSVSFWWE